MSKSYFGQLKNGKRVHAYTLKNTIGMEAVFLDFGAIWLSMQVPDKNGNKREMVLGHPTLSGYEANGDMFGAFVGPVANRTEKGRFSLDGTEYQMEINDGENNLHTSTEGGFHKVMWDVSDHDDTHVSFRYHRLDMECGLPGNMDITLIYTLTEAGEVRIEARAVSDKKTIINLTHHAYFNLKGAGKGDIMDTTLWINAEKYTPLRAGGIPTGEIAEVAGTPFDFRAAKPMGRDFFSGHEQQLLVGGGYDHNFVIKDSSEIVPEGKRTNLRIAAKAYCADTGISLEMYHNKPGLQLYTGNWIGIEEGRGGTKLGKYSGFCLETHGFTNAVNTPGFPSPILEVDSTYEMTTIYKFGLE